MQRRGVRISFYRILAIDGGEIRGVIPAVLLTRMERRWERPADLCAASSVRCNVCGLTLLRQRRGVFAAGLGVPAHDPLDAAPAQGPVAVCWRTTVPGCASPVRRPLALARSPRSDSRSLRPLRRHRTCGYDEISRTDVADTQADQPRDQKSELLFACAVRALRVALEAKQQLAVEVVGILHTSGWCLSIADTDTQRRREVLASMTRQTSDAASNSNFLGPRANWPNRISASNRPVFSLGMNPQLLSQSFSHSDIGIRLSSSRCYHKRSILWLVT